MNTLRVLLLAICLPLVQGLPVAAADAPSTLKLNALVYDLEHGEVFDCDEPLLEPYQQESCLKLLPTRVVPLPNFFGPQPNSPSGSGWYDSGTNNGDGTITTSCGYYHGEDDYACELNWGSNKNIYQLIIYYCGCPSTDEHATTGIIHNYLALPADAGYYATFIDNSMICSGQFGDLGGPATGVTGSIYWDETPGCSTNYVRSGTWGVGVTYWA